MLGAPASSAVRHAGEVSPTAERGLEETARRGVVDPASCLLAALVALLQQERDADRLAVELYLGSEAEPAARLECLTATTLQALIRVVDQALAGRAPLATSRRVCLVADDGRRRETFEVRRPTAAGATTLTVPESRLEAGRTQLLLARLTRLVEDLPGSLDRPIGELTWFSDKDERIIANANATDRHWAGGPTVPADIAACMARTPDALAVEDDYRPVTYGQLAAMANQINGQLRASGVRPGDLVAIALPRTAEYIATVLGIWGAGAAFLPIEASHPPARIEFQLKHASVRAIVQSRSRRAVVPGYQLIHVERDDQLPAPQRLDTPVCRAEGLAYIMYTSGSTGVPKAVAVSHGSFHNAVHAIAEPFQPTSVDRFSALNTFACDVSLTEAYLPLAYGAATMIVGEATQVDTVGLARWFSDKGVTVAHATPTQWRLLLPHLGAGLERMLVATCGEPLSATLARELLARCGRLWNFYGPTEVTVFCSAGRVREDDLDPVPIGAPLANVTIEILDEQLRRLPVGRSGELYVGGRGVALGYHNAPELTAERFVRYPGFGRLYRTGDICRWRPDGKLEFLGRADRQIKVASHRVELGEIEVIAERHPAVDRAAVQAVPGSDGDVELTLYVQVRADRGLTERELRRHLAQQVPAHMLPRRITVLAEFPLTATRKIDRKALFASARPAE
jgi:amino acid adenylation domain-containing protein